MEVEDFKAFVGQHCETTATGCLLQNLGVELSEPMMFGLGEGLGFIFWNMKTMDCPFLGGRIKTDVLTQNLCRNLNLTLDVRESTSAKKSWKNVTDLIEAGTPVGLKLDCFHLDYFSVKFHFAGHYVAMYGYDDKFAYLVDTDQQGGLVKTSLKNLALARNEKGPMSSRNLSFSISRGGKDPDLAKSVTTAIHNNAQDYLNPPITNFSYKGILKTSREIRKWFKTTQHVKRDFQLTAVLMERAGTGGALFRNLYRDFLIEASELTSIPELQIASQAFAEIALLWTSVSEHFFDAGETSDVEYINTASDMLVDISAKEKDVMEALFEVTAA